MPNNNQQISETQIHKIEICTSKGQSDMEISKKMGISYSSVGKYTRAYWNRKMKEKNEQTKDTGTRPSH